MNKDEALKLALEALETSARNWPSDSVIEAITAIKEALAHPKQHQDWWHYTEALKMDKGKLWYPHIEENQSLGGWRPVITDCFIPYRDGTKFYTRPPQRTWVGLTDEEIQYCVELKNPEAIAEEVEAKLKEKNT